MHQIEVAFTWLGRGNRIGGMASIECLGALPALKSLVLVGNPITETEGYKKRVIAALKHLTELDDEDVSQCLMSMNEI